MPKLWSHTIDSHRRTVREAALDATEALIAERGLLGVTMSHIAEAAGIGRATLYKYFPDLEAIVTAWHERHVNEHLAILNDIRRGGGSSYEQLEAILHAVALLAYEISNAHHGTELATMLHGGKHVVGRAERQLHDLVRAVLHEGVMSGDIRSDVPDNELATYCLHALGGASTLSSKASVRRLVSVTLEGLRPPD